VVHGGRRCDAAELFGGKAEVPKIGLGAAMEVVPHAWRRRYRGCSATARGLRLCGWLHCGHRSWAGGPGGGE
jgi:hypothetical protein